MATDIQDFIVSVFPIVMVVVGIVGAVTIMFVEILVLLFNRLITDRQ